MGLFDVIKRIFKKQKMLPEAKNDEIKGEVKEEVKGEVKEEVKEEVKTTSTYDVTKENTDRWLELIKVDLKGIDNKQKVQNMQIKMKDELTDMYMGKAIELLGLTNPSYLEEPKLNKSLIRTMRVIAEDTCNSAGILRGERVQEIMRIYRSCCKTLFRYSARECEPRIFGICTRKNF